ncbi:Glycine betaine transport system permease protein OpuAB [Jannaschia seosinensis]|uniref:Glycine betaine transport system permease protein OpuAB n=1 Tax=Jannaschia seosinensis TaxID=313367 RepID=A0A0M7B9V2_9RHOB|nr:ABC transporter permease subunit [Jannaschia seosinensis]CUH39577.1 Glycine betaine transport system permease protein OpuAB [Jannaschia seosinensis]
MATYDGLFEALGLGDWCGGGATGGPMTMAELLARAQGGGTPDGAAEPAVPLLETPFPSLDALNQACGAIPRSRDMTRGVEQGFLAIKDPLKVVLDPITQPLSWMLDLSLEAFQAIPWFIMIPLLIAIAWFSTKKAGVTLLVAFSFLFMAFINYYDDAIQTLSIIFVCTIIAVLLGVPVGIAMSRSNALQRSVIPVLDMLQTLPTFVYLVPLIFLFSVTESKLYGIAIILYAIVPVIRLTDLGIRLVDKDVIEAADAFGMSSRQKLWGVQIPLALPNIMAGVNQTIMMSLAMVVIASLVSAPGLGVKVLAGIRNLELGVGLVAGFCIVLLAVLLDRSTKAALGRIDASDRG